MLQGRRLVVVGVLFAAVALPLLGLFVISVPAVHAHRLAPASRVAVGLDQLGVSSGTYAAAWTVLIVAFGLLALATAGLIVWRRPREPIAWTVALLLTSLGTSNAPAVGALVRQRPGLEPAAQMAFQLLLISLVVFLFTFPDGRWHPRRSWLAVAAAVPGFLVAGGSLDGPIPDALFFALLVGLLGGLAAQVHRYRRVSDETQRQQTRWVLHALAVAVAAQVAVPALEVLPVLQRPGGWAAVHDLVGGAVVSIAYALLVSAIAIAVLRRRLWQLDAVVNRALVYGGVTVLLLGAYVGAVVALGSWVSSPSEAGGTLLAAALVALAFAPLRDRLQRGVNRLLYGQRHEPYRALADLGHRLEATVAPEAVLTTIAETVAAALRSPHVELVVEGEGVAEISAAAGPGTPAPPPDADPLAVTLVHQHERVAELRIAPRGPRESFNPADRELLDDLARQAAPAVHAVRLTEELRRSRERLVTAREEERRRLHRDLHDGLGPALASMALQAETASELALSRPELTSSILADLVDQLEASTAEVRRLVHDLRPAALEDRGLADALRTFVARSSTARLRCSVTLDETLDLSAAGEVAVYRIVQEAVANVLRHADATRCAVSVGAHGSDGVVVEVVDDGGGIDPEAPEGIGLRSMRERASELGGRCQVTPQPGGGTRVHATLPRTSPAGAVT